MRGLHGKVVLVAGAATGIGAATATRLAEEGARVAVGDIDFDRAQETADAICRADGEAIAIRYDQSDESSIALLVRAVTDHYGALHGVHCNAADLRAEVLQRDRNVMNMSADLWAHLLKVNLIGFGLIVREALPHLLAAGGGGIVCTSSDAPELGMSSQPAYAVSKAGVNALVRHVASRWGKEGVRANAVAPGLVLSEKVAGDATPASLEKMLDSTRSPRLGEPADIAGAVTFLLSDDGAWVNGQIWGIDGGLVYRG
jgi:NAD(P)-dependent dehydrogenase (short-subunit alcohol dehydrogenase family)